MPAFWFTRFSRLLSAATMLTNAVAGVVLLSACASAAMAADDSHPSKSATDQAAPSISASKLMVTPNPDGTFTIQKEPPNRNSKDATAEEGLVIPPQVVVPLVPAVGTLPAPGLAPAQTPDPNAGKQLLRQYAGSDNWDALYRHPKVLPQLQQLLGTELRHLRDNLDVSGAVDVVGGALTINGNAPHQGTEEEAVVCVSTYNLEVTAAIYSRGIVTAYSRKKTYDDLPRCIKDWVTLVNSEHRDRSYQPKNVRMAGGK